MTSNGTASLATEAEPESSGPAPHETKRRSLAQSILQFEVTKRRIPLKDLQQFSRELAVFMKAGIPIMEALELIRAETGSRVFGEVLDEIIASIHAGSTFSEATARRADAFPKYYLG